MNTIFVLLMIFSPDDHRGGGVVIQQEFSSYENCQAARKHMAAAHKGTYGLFVLRAQGCFKK
jgi:hypothetical protein